MWEELHSPYHSTPKCKWKYRSNYLISSRLTIRGEHLGIGEQDLAGVFINGADCLLISEWKTDRKILALAPAKEGKGDIIIATKSGGIGSCEVCKLAFSHNLRSMLAFLSGAIQGLQGDSWPSEGECSLGAGEIPPQEVTIIAHFIQTIAT